MRVVPSRAGGAIWVAGSAVLLIIAAISFAGGRSDRYEVAAEVPVTAADRVIRPANNSPVLVADPTDASFLVAASRVDGPEFGCTLHVSGDGGQGWVPASPVPALPVGAERCYAPEASFDSVGRLYLLFVGLAGQGNRPMGVFITASDDRARTFSPPRQVLGPNSFGVRMAVQRAPGGQDRLHLVWIRAGSEPGFGGFGGTTNPIMTAYSDDGGQTFSPPLQVSSTARQRVVAPALSVGPRGEVHVAYYDLGNDARDYQGLDGTRWDGKWSLILRTSSDGGRRFGPETVVDRNIVASERVMLIFTMPPPAIAATGGRICIAWTDGRNGDPDVLLSCRAGRSRPWDGPRRLNDDRMGNGSRQYLPRLSTTNGRIDAVFYDRRVDIQNRLTDVAYTFSLDGGRSFAPNVRLTSESSNSEIGSRYGVPSANGQVEMGGRLGLLSRPNEAVGAWADVRNGQQRTTGQDIFATTVRFDERRRSAAGTAAVPIGVVMAAVLAAIEFRRRRRSARWPE